jgi:hypothetical protein
MTAALCTAAVKETCSSDQQIHPGSIARPRKATAAVGDAEKMVFLHVQI